ncbi:programmed cell death protein 2 isoform X2 [Phyllostomus discolor]|uniref:Programmed cell death protein 2 isoform X2 n=1 Tax=Phyllostomus discolor TaxID=89673 RepID=A0A7E6DPN9_9CHIR|nr:programmed cell death protein 2 isoform X2 [Phyllostomus discolor]
MAVELGFVEAAPAWRLRSEQFPSKVGGRPAWLGEAGLPGPAELACARCGRPLAFLLQLYAPLPGRADAFHRGLFLFCCRAPPCCAGLRVFRNQLPRENDFYSHEPPAEEPPPETGEPVRLQLLSGPRLCRVCGCLGPKTCSGCHRAHYCSRDHQTLDWRAGHRQACGQAENSDNTVPDHNFLFPEFEIVIETEDEITPEVLEREDESEVTGSMGHAAAAQPPRGRQAGQERGLGRPGRLHLRGQLRPGRGLRGGVCVGAGRVGCGVPVTSGPCRPPSGLPPKGVS